MPRLFTAIPLPTDVRQRLVLLQSGLDNVRWVDGSDLHITLKFIGDVGPTQAGDIVEALAARPWKSPPIEVGELAQFGGKNPRSVHATVRPNEALLNLQMAQETLMHKLGLPREQRKYSPHITLGRGRGLKPEKVARYLSNHAGLAFGAFKPDAFCLYSARDSIGGGPYHPIETFPFERLTEA